MNTTRPFCHLLSTASKQIVYYSAMATHTGILKVGVTGWFVSKRINPFSAVSVHKLFDGRAFGGI